MKSLLNKKLFSMAMLAMVGMLAVVPLFVSAQAQPAAGGTPDYPFGMTMMTWLKNVLNLLFGGIIIIAIIIIVLSGYDMIVAQGDPTKAAKAKEQIAWAVIGIIVALVALALVNFVLLKGGSSGITPG